VVEVLDHRYKQVEMVDQVVVVKLEHLEAVATHQAHHHHKVVMVVLD
jgi:hypothetical protein